MVEKWLQSKSNPYISKKVATQRSSRVIHKVRPLFKRGSAHYGMPSQLFKDSDKDGVMNVFDCKPFNKKKQDVISPMGGGDPLSSMFSRRENARLFENQQRELARIRALEEAKLEELRRIQTPIIRQERNTWTGPTTVNPTTYMVWSPSAGKYVKTTDKPSTSGGETSSGSGGTTITPKPKNPTPYQGPIKPGTSEEIFRETGKSVPI